LTTRINFEVPVILRRKIMSVYICIRKFSVPISVLVPEISQEPTSLNLRYIRVIDGILEFPGLSGINPTGFYPV